MRKVTAELNPYEDAMVSEIMTHGFSEEEIVRFGIRLLHKKEFPGYRKKKKEELSYTAEDCLREGGEIVKKDSERYCKITTGALESLKLIC